MNDLKSTITIALAIVLIFVVFAFFTMIVVWISKNVAWYILVVLGLLSVSYLINIAFK